MKAKLFAFLLLTFCLVTIGPLGCATQKASPTGDYKGDTVLRNVEKATVEAYQKFDEFLRWEEKYRNILPVEVSRAADVIRLNAKTWINSAIALRDAYLASPTGPNRDKMKLALDLIQTGLNEALTYQERNAAKAPPLGATKK